MRRGTYSIVARDPTSGQLGVAVQSHWFGVGMVVPWAEAGVGAVATQSIVERSYGPRACALMRHEALDAHEALERLAREDSAAAVRQVGLVDAHGNAAAHTGELCIREAGHVTGDGYSCQANMMLNATVPQAMADAFEAGRDAPLDERLIAALYAAEHAGGDIRGRQSAALLVVGKAGDEAWQRDLDLRVDDHPDPLAELRRLHTLHRAYETSERAEELTAEGRHDEAAPLYVAAAELAPDNDELLFWSGLAAAQAGDLKTALARVNQAAGRNPRWIELLDRLGPEIAPAAEQVRSALGRR